MLGKLALEKRLKHSSAPPNPNAKTQLKPNQNKPRKNFNWLILKYFIIFSYG